MSINKLAANDSKTHILVIKKGREDQELSFDIGSATIKESKNEKLLGVWVQNDLKWATHLEKLEVKLLSSLYHLRQIEQVMPRSLLKRVADGLFCSNIRYAVGLYCPIRIKETDPKPSSINGINVVYNDVLRLLCCSRRENRKPIKTMLEEIGWLSLNQLACETRLVEVWKSLNIDNYCLKDLFEKVEHNRFTRESQKIRLKSSFRSQLRENSFQYPSVQLWNSAPHDVTNAYTETKARTAIRAYVKTLPI